MGVALCIVCFTINRVYSLFIFGRTVSKRKMEKNNGKELDTFKSVIKDQLNNLMHTIIKLIINK